MDDSDELHLELYKSLRSEAEMHLKSMTNNMRTGIAGIATVVGYALYSEIYQFVALTPFIFGIVAHEIIQDAAGLSYLSSQLVRIETELKRKAEHFDWEQRFGVIGDGRSLEIKGFDITGIGVFIPAVIVAAAYIGFSMVSVKMWTRCPTSSGNLGPCRELPTLGGLEITPEILFWLYLLLGVVLSLEVAITLYEVYELNDEVELPDKSGSSNDSVPE